MITHGPTLILKTYNGTGYMLVTEAWWKKFLVALDRNLSRSSNRTTSSLVDSPPSRLSSNSHQIS